jgi:hypothetical protein
MKTSMPEHLELGDRFRRVGFYLHDISPQETHIASGLDGETGYTGRIIRGWDGAAALVVLIILLKAAILFFRGETYGRLAIPPVYDDVTYFVDGLERVIAFKAGGLGALLSGLLRSPPHSPYATFGAFFGFLITGNSTIAPYAFNAIAVAVLTVLLLVLFEVRQLPGVLMVIAMTATAWFDNAITVYHPDLIAGYATAIVAAATIFQRQLRHNKSKTIVVGVLAGFALLVKPTAFPAILSVWSVAFGFGCIASLIDREPFAVILRRLGIVIICVALFAGPYFAVHLVDTVKYIYQAFFTDVDAWNQVYLARDGQVDRFWFYIHQTYDLFRAILWVSCALLAIALVTAIHRRQLPRVIEILGLFAVVVVTYIIPTLAPVKLMLFGALLYGAVIVSFFVLLRLVSDLATVIAGRGTFRSVQTLGVVLIWVAAVGALKQDGQSRFPAVLLRDGQIEYDRMYAAITQAAKAGGIVAGQGFSIFFPTAGPLPPSDFRFRGLKSGINITVTQTPLETSLERLETAANMSKLTLIPDEPLVKALSNYPVNNTLGELTQRLRSDNSFREQASVELPDGKMLLFVNDHEFR